MNEKRFRCGCSIAWDERGVTRFHTALPTCAKARSLAGTYRNFAAMVRAFSQAHSGTVRDGQWFKEHLTQTRSRR